jgi:hypothetical protein
LALLVLTLFFILIPSINAYIGKTTVFDLSNSVFLFVTLYFYAGYIKRFDISIKFYKGVLLFLAFGALGAACTWYVNVGLYGSTAWWHGFVRGFFLDSGIIVVLGGLFLFLAFKSITLENKYVNILGKSTYDGYLIQNLVLYIVMDWIKYVQYFKSDILTFSAVTLGIVLLVTAISLGYGVLRMGIDKVVVSVAHKMLGKEGRIEGGSSPKGEAQCGDNFQLASY